MISKRLKRFETKLKILSCFPFSFSIFEALVVVVFKWNVLWILDSTGCAGNDSLLGFYFLFPTVVLARHFSRINDRHKRTAEPHWKQHNLRGSVIRRRRAYEHWRSAYEMRFEQEE